jgi:hypothetical protein
VLTVAAVVAVALMLLTPFGGEAHPPTSFDAPYYVWRTRLVAVEGLDALARLPDGSVPHPDRAGFPALGAILLAVTRLDALTLVVVLRAVAAISIGAAAAAFAKESLREPSWSWPWFVLGVGASAAVIGAAIGSLEQLVVEVLLLGTAAIVPLVAHGGRGTIAAAGLLAAAGLTHWIFTGLFLGVLLGTVVVLALLSLRGSAGSNGVVEAPARSAVRVAGLTAAGLAAAGVALLLLPALPTAVPEVVGEKGNLTRLGSYELALLLPLAAIGTLTGVWGARGTRRTGIVLMAVWAATVPVAMVVSALLPTSLKLFRIAPFALGIPVLATLAIVTLARLAGERLGAPGWAVAVVLLVGGLLLAIGTPRATFDDAYGALVTERMEQARIAGRFVDEVARGRPVVFTTRGDPVLIDRVVRAWVPADGITDTWVYVGAPDDLATGEPVDDPERAVLTGSSQAWWRRAWPDPAGVLGRDPVVIDIGAVDRPPPPGFVALAPGLSAAEASRTADGPSSIGAGWGKLLLGVGAVLVVLVLVGGGWARLLLDVSSISAALLAPAVGVAALIVGGAALGRTGVPLGGAWGVGLLAVTGGVGWLFSWGKRAR